jgi:hypothetical protein
MSCRCNFFKRKINFLIKLKEVKMQEIKKVGLMSVAKVLALFGVLMGLLFGIQMGFLSANNPLTFSEATEYVVQDPTIALTAYTIALGWWSIIVSPILMGIVYFVSGIILAWLFNMFTKLVGGVKIELSENKAIKKKK